jgi:hypothetical protein
MKAISKMNKPSARFLATLACMIVAGSLSASAVNTTEVSRILTSKTITAKCCVLFGASVSVTEPPTVSAVVVTWSADYQTSLEFRVGLSVNGGACVSYGPTVAPALSIIGGSQFASTTYQWIVFPSDGLKAGANTFAVCGGGSGSPVTMTFGANTLAARLSN